MTNNLQTAGYFQVFLSNINNYIISSNYFYSIKVICLHTPTWFQKTNKSLFLTISASSVTASIGRILTGSTT